MLENISGLWEVQQGSFPTGCYGFTALVTAGFHNELMQGDLPGRCGDGLSESWLVDCSGNMTHRPLISISAVRNVYVRLV